MKKIKNNIELVSLHIPKTAGTAFRLILTNNIDPKNFAKLDIFNSGRIKLNDEYFSGSKLSRKLTVIHGHFSYQRLHEFFEINTDTQFITWLREPVQRVLSNYFFLKSILEQRIAEQPDENLFRRMGKSLEEFVALEENQNVMSKFLDQAPIEQFKFIGIQDNFAEELPRLKQLMGWSYLDNQVHNETRQKNTDIDSGIIEQIKQANAQDVELYQRVLALKGKVNSAL